MAMASNPQPELFVLLEPLPGKNKNITRADYCEEPCPICGRHLRRNSKQIRCIKCQRKRERVRSKLPWVRKRRKNITNNDPDILLRGRWRCMMHRCYVSSDPRFHVYGAAGIRVCKPWHKFEQFKAWWNSMPAPKLNLGERVQIHRHHDDMGYGPLNCVKVSNREHSRITWERTKKCS